MTTRKTPVEETPEAVEEVSGAVVVPKEEMQSLDLISWDEAVSSADTVLGRELTKEDLFDKLVGVPFLITAMITRPGKGVLETLDGRKLPRDYFTCEARLAPAHVMQQRKVNLENILPLAPESLIVFNDASTGIRRQIVQYLHGSKKIELPGEIRAAGKLGESSFDLPVQEWTQVHSGEVWFDPSGFALYRLTYLDGWKGLMCPRGIRLSDYQNEYTGDDKAVTRYLA